MYSNNKQPTTPDYSKRLINKLAEQHNLDVSEVFFTKKLAYKDIVNARQAVIEEDNAYIK